MEMEDDFHLSIKNNLRKIKDVRDLFKDLTQKELNVLEFEKKKSEMSALIKKNLSKSPNLSCDLLKLRSFNIGPNKNTNYIQNLAKVEKKEVFILRENNLIKTSEENFKEKNRVLSKPPIIEHQVKKVNQDQHNSVQIPILEYQAKNNYHKKTNNKDYIGNIKLDSGSENLAQNKTSINDEKFYFYFQNDLDNKLFFNDVGDQDGYKEIKEGFDGGNSTDAVGFCSSILADDDFYTKFMNKNVDSNELIKKNRTKNKVLSKKNSYDLKIEDNNIQKPNQSDLLNKNCNNALKTKLRNCLESELGIKNNKEPNNLKCKLSNKLNQSNKPKNYRSSHLNLIMDNIININSYQDFNNPNNGYVLSNFENWDYLVTQSANSNKTTSCSSTKNSSHTTSSSFNNENLNFSGIDKEKLIAIKNLNLKTINGSLDNPNAQLGQYFYDYKTNGFKYMPHNGSKSSQSSGSNNSLNNMINANQNSSYINLNQQSVRYF